MSQSSLIKLENVSWAYSRAGQWALNNISMEIGEGDFVAVMGANGAGKTTFCRLLNGLIPHSLNGKLRGTVTIDGIKTTDTTVTRLAHKTGMAFEDPNTQLLTTRVFDEAAFGLENLLLPRQEITERVQWALNAAGLAGLQNHSPSALSGGQKQRLAIAAALAMAEKILVLDEPASQLDPAGAREVLSLIGELRGRRGLTVVMATNSGDEAAEFADKICVLDSGRLAAYGGAREIFSALSGSKTDLAIQIPQVSEFALCMADIGETLPHYPVSTAEAGKSVLDWYHDGK